MIELLITIFRPPTLKVTNVLYITLRILSITGITGYITGCITGCITGYVPSSSHFQYSKNVCTSFD